MTSVYEGASGTSLGDKPVSEMSLIEIAEQLEKVTSWIEVERVKEREARAQYQVVATQVEAKIQQIRKFAEELVAAHARKLNAFNGMLNRQPEAAPSQNGSKTSRNGHTSVSRPVAVSVSSGDSDDRRNLADYIESIWTLSRYSEPLTTEEIAEALPDTGYKTNAAPNSIKSSINQSLAKLCQAGRVVRLRADGSRIPARDLTSRARKYVSAPLAPEE
jgi:chromosome segregation and condensation protein ScpB